MIKGATTRIGIYGTSGCGKSTLAKQLIKSIERIIVFDPMAEYEAQGFTVVKSVVDLLKHSKSKKFKLAYQMNVDAKHSDELAKVAQAVFLVQKPYAEGKNFPQMTFLIEEMALSIPNVQNAKSLSYMTNMANMGRHFGINLIGIAQRPANVNTTVRACFTENYFFMMNLMNDIQAVSEFIGKTNANKILQLNRHEAIHYMEGKTIEKHKNILD